MRQFWVGKKVFVTGHTGFKGAWLSLWLLQLGAEVKGLSLVPGTSPALFEQLGLAPELEHQVGDIQDGGLVRQSVSEFQPDIVFHLAAQPLVRQSYLEPVETWNTNVMGTIHVLESLKYLTHPCAAVLITTDKCYENREWVYGYRETDPLGGYDPYSSSKAAAELAIASWRRSFFNRQSGCIGIGSARAGNVIGGGDWAKDRIVPDTVRSLMRQEPIPIRNPKSTRPWQHVLEPLGGYLLLAEKIYQTLTSSTFSASKQLEFCSAFNFGPSLSSNRTVQELVETMLQYWPGSWLDQSDPHAVHEAGLLNLVTDKAFHLLKWQPVWDFERTIQETICWYQAAAELGDRDIEQFQALTLRQIEQYQLEQQKNSQSKQQATAQSEACV